MEWGPKKIDLAYVDYPILFKKKKNRKLYSDYISKYSHQFFELMEHHNSYKKFKAYVYWIGSIASNEASNKLMISPNFIMMIILVGLIKSIRFKIMIKKHFV